MDLDSGRREDNGVGVGLEEVEVVVEVWDRIKEEVEEEIIYLV